MSKITRYVFNILIYNQSFCAKCRFDDRETVRKAKVVQFFQNKVLNRAHRIQKFFGDNGEEEKEGEENED